MGEAKKQALGIIKEAHQEAEAIMQPTLTKNAEMAKIKQKAALLDRVMEHPVGAEVLDEIRGINMHEKDEISR